MNVFARKNILLSFSVLAAFLLSGCSMDPDVEITNKNVKDAVSSLSKADAAKVAALGGDKYLLGKTLNKVSKQLPADYYNYEINELVEHARLNREFNLHRLIRANLLLKQLDLILQKVLTKRLSKSLKSVCRTII